MLTKLVRRLRFDPGLGHLRGALATIVAALLTFWSVLGIKDVRHLHIDVVVIGVSLAVVLGRVLQDADPLDRAVGLVVVPLATVAATKVGAVIPDHANLGDALFVVAVSGGIWVRRLGPRFSKAGTLATLPFIANLVKPVPQPTGNTYLLWSALVATIAFGWVGVLHLVARYPRRPRRPTAAPAAGGAARATTRPPRRGLARIRPSTRMAIQMGVALAGAFALGRHEWPDHWVWPVLTAYIVASGNRGRADVLFKGVLRILGAVVGTTVASLFFVGEFGAGSRDSIVAIFLILTIANWLRPLNYAYWAGCVTAALAFLYGYFGQTGSDLLRTRLAGILWGGVVAIVAAWFILPLRTTDVLRRRRAEALAVLTDLLAAARAEPARLPYHRVRFDRAVEELNHLAPPLETARLVSRGWRTRPAPADSIDAVRRAVQPVHTIVDCAAVLGSPGLTKLSGLVALNVGALRRAIAEHSPPRYQRLPQLNGRAGPAGAALAELDAAVSSLAEFHTSTLTPRHAGHPRVRPAHQKERD